MEVAFWVCLALVAYPYVGYPLLLVALNRICGRRAHESVDESEPMVSIIIPIHNEAARISAKLRNVMRLDYPRAKLDVIVVGDGCTDDSLERARETGGDLTSVVALPEHLGKAAALNAGLRLAKGEIVVFTDAGIQLEPYSLRKLLSHFYDPSVGCVSGEDYIEGAETEGIYGRLELLLRREEARLHSIAGASGCYYAQRRELCGRFTGGTAPDFLSVINTVRSGYRALAEPAARGSMTAASSQRAEYARKVRTILRGMTTLSDNPEVLIPWRHLEYSFVLVSHKVLRWFASIPMAGCLLSSALLAGRPLFAGIFAGQALLYAAAIAGLLWPRTNSMFLVRLSAFFLLVNGAALHASLLWLRGTRIEVWSPTVRPT